MLLIVLFIMNVLANPAVAQNTNDASVPGYKILEISIEDTIQLETENLQKRMTQLKQLQNTNQAYQKASSALPIPEACMRVNVPGGKNARMLAWVSTWLTNST